MLDWDIIKEKIQILSFQWFYAFNSKKCTIFHMIFVIKKSENYAKIAFPKKLFIMHETWCLYCHAMPRLADTILTFKCSIATCILYLYTRWRRVTHNTTLIYTHLQKTWWTKCFINKFIHHVDEIHVKSGN